MTDLNHTRGGKVMTNREATDRRIRMLLRDLSVGEVAEVLSIETARVLGIWKSMPRSWVLRDNRTGRVTRHISERACYFQAQLRGLVDYDFGRAQ